MSTLTERHIECTACGQDFTFSVEEQEFYLERGFQDPRKCKPCRDAAKAARNQGGRGGYGGGSRGGYGGGGGGYGRPQRQLYDAVCASCSVPTKVPFQPNGSKPVYCRDCYHAQSYGAM